MKTRRILVDTFLLLASLRATIAFTTVETTGPYATGVRDFDFVDTVYPSDLHPNDAGGRRIMFRIYYPACKKENLTILSGIDGNTTATCNGASMGRRRDYLQPREWEVFFGIPEPTQVSSLFDKTQSYLEAPILLEDSITSFPVVIYSHGFGSWISDNTALVEEIASHGYIVCAVASPGFTGGVLYPSDGHVVTSQNDYPEISAAIAQDLTPNPYLANYTSDLQVRYDRMEEYLSEGTIPMLVQRMNDDLVAVADYLDAAAQQTQISTSSTKSSASFSNFDPFLLELFQDSEGLDQNLAYMGFSLGGSAAGSAAHADDRAMAAINLDGGHQSLDLWNTEIRTPYLMFFEQTELAWFYHGEFLFENLVTMGSRTDIIRVLGPQGVQHNDYTDQKLFSPALRSGLLGITQSVDGLRMHHMLSDFCLGFLDRFVRGDTTWDPETSFAEHDETAPIDVSYVADWAKEKFATEEPTATPDESSAPASFASARVWCTLLVSMAITAVLQQR